MKRSHLLHASWGMAALGTFALGYTLARTGASGPHQASESATARNRALFSQNSPLGAAPSSANAKTTGAGREGAATAPGSAGPAALTSPEAIAALAKEAFGDPNPLTRNLAFARMLESLTPENAAAMMESLRANEAGGERMQLFLYAWGARDSAGMLAHADTLEGREKERFLSASLPGWASANPQGAIAWLNTLEEGDAKNRHRASLVSGLADHDIGTATSYVLSLAAAGDKLAPQYIQNVASEELRKNGPAAAVLWGEQLPEGPVKAEALEQIAGSYVDRDPQAAAAWAQKYATTATGSGIIEEIGEEWAERDPKSAVTWLGGLAEGQAKSEGTFSALREWTRRDPAAASQYLAAMPASASKDSAISGFARSLSREDPEAAVIWAKTITNETSRVQTLTQAGQAWFRRDPAAASTWLQGAQLPARVQQAILNPPQDNRRRG